MRNLEKEKELLAETSSKEKDQLKEKFESQMAESDNEHKAEVRKLSSRVEILSKEKELQKEQYESQIAELDSTIRGLESKKSGKNS